jgi:hypothetical protein
MYCFSVNLRPRDKREIEKRETRNEKERSGERERERERERKFSGHAFVY